MELSITSNENLISLEKEGAGAEIDGISHSISYFQFPDLGKDF